MEPSGPRLRRDLAHLTLAWCLAVAQPLLSLLGEQPQFLVAQGVIGARAIALALLLCFAAPALLGVILYGVGLAAPRAAALLAHALIAVLLAVAALPLLAALPPWPALAAAIAIGAALAFGRARTRAGRSFANVFALAIPVFPLAFLLLSPARELIAGRVEQPSVAVAAEPRPVYLFLFDEFPVVSLMNRALEIDAGRFPNFASLAATATWYRHATTVSEATVIAVPAALTGYFPAGDKMRLAVHSQYPQTLYTLLAETHEVHAQESGTQLCPPRVCADASDHSGMLVSDLWIVYQHLVLPEDWRDDLPSIQQGWTGFASPEPAPSEDVEGADQMHRRMNWRGRLTRFREFLGAIADFPPNTFHFYHALLPHAPWSFLPDGRRYAYLEPGGVLGVRPQTDPGPLKHTWYPDPVAADLGHRRHLLQVGAVDRLVGEILDSIRATGQFDDALIVIAGDHGAAFEPGHSRRAVDSENFAAIAGIPLFVKYPHQREGSVVDAPARLADLTPTILKALGVAPVGDMDGVPLESLDPQKRPLVRIVTDDRQVRELEFAAYRQRLAAQAVRQSKRYGSGGFEGVIRPAVAAGETWVGRPLAELEPEPVGQARVSVHNQGLYVARPAPDFVPAYLRATIDDLAGLPLPGRVLIALDGQLVTAAEPFASPGLENQFATLLPPARVESGFSQLRFYWQPRAEPKRLIALDEPCPAPRLAGHGDHTGLHAGCDGAEIPVAADTYHGQVVARRRADGLVAVSGWSGNTLTGHVPAEILLFIDDVMVARTVPELERPDLIARYQQPALGKAGFQALLSGHDDALSRLALRAVARGPDGASELNYPPPGSERWPFAPPSGPPSNPIPVSIAAVAHARLADGTLARAPTGDGYDLGETLDLTSDAVDPLLIGEWYGPSGGIRWAGARMALAFALAPDGPELELELRVWPFLADGQVPAQRLRFSADGATIHETVINRNDAHQLSIPIPAAAVDAEGLLVIEIEAPDAAIPKQLGISEDLRRLSVAWEWARLSAR